MARSVLAVVGGYAVMAACIVALDSLLAFLLGGTASAATRPTALMVLDVVFGIPCGVLGGYVCALIARRAEVMHALVLGMVGEAMSIASLFLYWNTQPHWYGIALALIILPSTLLGGYVRAIRLRASRG